MEKYTMFMDWKNQCSENEYTTVARGILVPLPGIKPVSPALQAGFLTTGPPGKSQPSYLF